MGKFARYQENPYMGMHNPTDHAAVKAHYEKCLANGCDPKFAEMLALRRAPGIKTDATFFAGMGEQFANKPALGDAYAAELRNIGGSPVGKRYFSQLAAYPGDPRAWVSSKSEIQSLCEERGWTCDGSVKVKAPLMAEPKPGVKLDPKIVDREVSAKIAENPEIAPTAKEREALWHDTYELRAPPKRETPRPLAELLAEEVVA